VARSWLAALTVLLHSSDPMESANDADRNRIRALLAQHGQVDSLGHFATRDDKCYIFSPTGNAAVAYRVKAGVCLAAETRRVGNWRESAGGGR
jgi:lysyl-tRNA synthetase, class II